MSHHYFVKIQYNDGTGGTCAHRHRTLGGALRCQRELPRLYTQAKRQPRMTDVMRTYTTSDGTTAVGEVDQMAIAEYERDCRLHR